MTFTKEQLIEQAQKNIKVLRDAVEKIPGGSDAAVIHLHLAEIALASLEAEPEAWLLSGGGVKNNVSFDSGNDYADPLREVTPLYTAPPAPVSVPDERPSLNNGIVGFDEGWNACRAAMLQGAEPVTTAYKLPVNTPCKDAPEHIWLQTAGVWPENGEFSELTWCSDNQHPDDTLYVRADVVAGNSPAIPDGWILVPIEPTQAMIDAHVEGVQSGGMQKGYRAMLAAAPQQEVTK